MLGVGVDWSEQFHEVAVGRPEEGVVEEFRVEHTPADVAGLVRRIALLEPDPGEVRVVLENRHGALVEVLLAAGYVVLPVNPDLVARRRGPARAKDDAADARICCRLALDRHLGLKQLLPHGDLAAELRSIARDDERAARDERRLLNRLRADLLAVFPAAVAFAGTDLGSPTVLRLLAAYPTVDRLQAVPRDELVAFVRAGRHGFAERFADRVQTALQRQAFLAPEALVRAKTDTITLTVVQLQAIAAQRRRWEHRMTELLLGGPRGHRRRPPEEDARGPHLPGGEIYVSFPGLGDRLAARIAGEIGERVEQFATANALACYAGMAPVTRRSGRSQFVVARRLAYNRQLHEAVKLWAFCSLSRSAWARQFYEARIQRGQPHHAALRALGNRWVEVLWHCLTKQVRYDETVHVANQQRHRGQTAA